MLPQDWKTHFDSEIALGYAARWEGNEGRARVCARRALALALADYLGRRGERPEGSDAVALIQLSRTRPDMPAGVQEKLAHFLVRVEPGGRFPIDADLLEEARWICAELVDESE